jgi:FHA domain
MASLVIHSEEPIQAAAFAHRVLIGRKPFNGVQLGQRVVSRIHAWIDREGDSFYIRDARSRGGTFVNSTRTDGKVMLHDGDVIKVGVSKMTFHDSDQLPDGAIVFNIAENGTNPDFADPGILIACEACGAPMWVPATMAGAFGRCAICAGAITVPGEPASGIRRPLTPNDSIVDMPAIVELGDAARSIAPLAADFPQPQPSAAARDCGVCQSPILPGDAIHQCASCSQTYHAECWNENHGCAAYGCPEVGSLDPVPAAVAIGDPADSPDAALAARTEMPAQETRAFPWDFALLGGSVLGTIVGAFSFGLPALVVGIASAVYARRQRQGVYGLATLSAVICLLGVAVGIITSSFIFNVTFPWRTR